MGLKNCSSENAADEPIILCSTALIIALSVIGFLMTVFVVGICCFFKFFTFTLKSSKYVVNASDANNELTSSADNTRTAKDLTLPRKKIHFRPVHHNPPSVQGKFYTNIGMSETEILKKILVFKSCKVAQYENLQLLNDKEREVEPKLNDNHGYENLPAQGPTCENGVTAPKTNRGTPSNAHPKIPNSAQRAIISPIMQ
uniref:Uncharacterized protein n=1 Tax=Panagrolaimus sp. ES5 TaxID=591445 RepID=A0AC34FP45_9BILA